MKTLLDIENYGIVLTEEEGKYRLEYPDCAAPMTYTEEFPTLDAALGRAVTLIMDVKQVYAFEELPYEYRAAYMGIAKSETANRAVNAFVYSVLEGIAYANMRKGN